MSDRTRRQDNFEDGDGCPDLDNDSDDIVDAIDACPNDPEDRDTFEDENGCPNPDNDDNDSVADAVDNCPDKPGTVEYQGCEKPQKVRLTATGIEIIDVVDFRTNKDVIRSVSFDLLRNVADVIKNHPEIEKIRVEGHTDDRGRDAYNLKLSQRRASSVVRFLVKEGVAADRLEARGFGEEQPLVENDTKENRAKNRRVEFKIVGAAIENRNSGPTSDTIDR